MSYMWVSLTEVSVFVGFVVVVSPLWNELVKFVGIFLSARSLIPLLHLHYFLLFLVKSSIIISLLCS